MKRNVLYLMVALPLLFSNCSKDDEPDKLVTLESSEKSLYFGDEYQINATSNTPIIYSSEDEYHASVSESGLVTARFVGETNIILSNENDIKKIKILVDAKSKLYPEPDLEFGISKSVILSKYGNPDSETETGIMYSDYSNSAPIVMYIFDENNKLKATGVLVKTAYSSSLGTFLAERYLPVDIDNFIFVNALETNDVTMLVGASLYDLSFWLVVYAPNSTNAKSTILKSTSLSDDFDKLFNQFKE